MQWLHPQNPTKAENSAHHPTEIFTVGGSSSIAFIVQLSKKGFIAPGGYYAVSQTQDLFGNENSTSVYLACFKENFHAI